VVRSGRLARDLPPLLQQGDNSSPNVEYREDHQQRHPSQHTQIHANDYSPDNDHDLQVDVSHGRRTELLPEQFPKAEPDAHREYQQNCRCMNAGVTLQRSLCDVPFHYHDLRQRQAIRVLARDD